MPKRPQRLYGEEGDIVDDDRGGKKFQNKSSRGSSLLSSPIPSPPSVLLLHSSNPCLDHILHKHNQHSARFSHLSSTTKALSPILFQYLLMLSLLIIITIFSSSSTSILLLSQTSLFNIYMPTLFVGVGAQFTWQKSDPFDRIQQTLDSVNGDNCKVIDVNRLFLPTGSVSHVPDIQWIGINPVFSNRTNLLQIHNMAMSRAFFLR